MRETENKKSILSMISQKREKHQNIISSGVNIFSKNDIDKSSKGQQSILELQHSNINIGNKGA